jgi:hypothetical protein
MQVVVCEDTANGRELFTFNTFILFLIMPEDQNNIKKSFNEDFCTQLEYHLSRAFTNSLNKEFKWLWCDGIKVPFMEDQLLKQHIIEKQKLVTEAWIGTSGQDIYTMTIKFGQCSTEKCRQGLSLNDCLPDDRSLNWVKLDLDKKEIELQLD